MQNVIYLGKDNPVIIEFTFTGDFADNGLSNFTDIQVTISDETYTLLLNPTNVVVNSNTELRVLIGADTSLDVGFYTLSIVGVSATYTNGYNLTSCGQLDRVQVK